MTLLEQLKYQYRTGGTYQKLIFINIAIYLFFTTIWMFCELMMWSSSKDWLHSKLAFHSEPLESIKHVWGIFTYMFLHDSRPIPGFWHLLFNMIFLYFSGRIFEDLLGPKKFLSTYIIGGFMGALFHFTSVNIFPKFFEASQNTLLLVGASASVSAIIMTIGLYAPKYEIYLFRTFKLKLIYIALFFILFEYLRLANNDGTSHFAHFGGAIWALILVNNLKKGRDLSTWMEKMVDLIAGPFKKKKIKIVYKKSKPVKKPVKDDGSRQEKVDAILDKIKASGYDSLSKEDKDYLFDASKNI